MGFSRSMHGASGGLCDCGEFIAMISQMQSYCKCCFRYFAVLLEVMKGCLRGC